MCIIMALMALCTHVTYARLVLPLCEKNGVFVFLGCTKSCVIFCETIQVYSKMLNVAPNPIVALVASKNDEIAPQFNSP